MDRRGPPRRAGLLEEQGGGSRLVAGDLWQAPEAVGCSEFGFGGEDHSASGCHRARDAGREVLSSPPTAPRSGSGPSPSSPTSPGARASGVVARRHPGPRTSGSTSLRPPEVRSSPDLDPSAVDPDLCGRFGVALIEGARVPPPCGCSAGYLGGPAAHQQRGRCVDYVMMEMGQPTHAYDAERPLGSKPTFGSARRRGLPLLVAEPDADPSALRWAPPHHLRGRRGGPGVMGATPPGHGRAPPAPPRALRQHRGPQSQAATPASRPRASPAAPTPRGSSARSAASSTRSVRPAPPCGSQAPACGPRSPSRRGRSGWMWTS